MKQVDSFNGLWKVFIILILLCLLWIIISYITLSDHMKSITSNTEKLNMLLQAEQLILPNRIQYFEPECVEWRLLNETFTQGELVLMQSAIEIPDNLLFRLVEHYNCTKEILVRKI